MMRTIRNMFANRVKTVPSVELGEAPHWDDETQSLYFVDIFKSNVHRYSPSVGEYACAKAGEEPVSFIIPVQGQRNKFVIASGRKLIVIEWNGKSCITKKQAVIAEVDNEGPARKNRINDGKCDPSGRLWFGTIHHPIAATEITPNAGSLYSMETDGSVRRHLENVSVSNGLAWNSSATKMYYVDSFTRTVDEFDFDITNGTISNRQPIFSLAKHSLDCFADGITIDAEDKVWVACFEGSAILRVDPEERDKLLLKCKLPCKQTTSVAFGGYSLNELYITSARVEHGEVLPATENGSLYKVQGLPAEGLPGVNVKLQC